MKDHSPIQNYWQHEEILDTAERFFGSLLKGINNATSSIDMDFYIFEEDALGRQVIDALITAAHKGVTVRVLIDGWGSMFSAGSIATQLSKAGIQVRIFHPFPFTPQVFRWSNQPGTRLQQFFNSFRLVNRRNHHKLCIVDRHQFWTGSFNISILHLGKEQGGKNWHDYGVTIRDNNLHPITDAFNHIFEQKTYRPRRLYLQKIRSNITSVLRRISNNLLVRRISGAQHRVWICNAYFSPSMKVLRAIRSARRKNVDVRIILPAQSDVFFMPLLSRTYYRKLLRQGVTIYEYQPSILHAKLILFDQQCMMGSSNLNHRSLLHDLELDIVLSHAESISRIEHLLLNDMKLSRKITLEDIEKQTVLLFFARFMRLFRYWI